MSRRRTGWSPESWLDEGPAEHVTRLGGFIEAEPVGRMRPILVHGSCYLENRARVRVPQAFSIHLENRK